MFERFDKGAREVVTNAQEVSRALKHNYIGTEHVLIALCGQKGSVACGVLEDSGVNEESAEALTLRIVGKGYEAVEGVTPFTPRAKKTFELALREALSDGSNLITPEYLLLGLLREKEGVAARVVLDLGNGLGYEEIKQTFEKFPTSEDLIKAQIQRQVAIRDQANAELRRLRGLLKKAKRDQSKK